MQEEETKLTEKEETTVENTNEQTAEDLVDKETTENEVLTEVDVEENKSDSVLEQTKSELAEFKDKYLRLFAEFDNFKKRSAKEKRDFALVAGQDIIKDLLPILDDIKRANQSLEQDNNADNYVQGAKLIFEKLAKALQQKGLKEMESIGNDFDVEKHEAIAEIPAPSEAQKGKIIDEVEAGYTLNNVMIRYAKVVVGK
jgi:molecular chaperone GrpE